MSPPAPSSMGQVTGPGIDRLNPTRSRHGLSRTWGLPARSCRPSAANTPEELPSLSDGNPQGQGNLLVHGLGLCVAVVRHCWSIEVVNASKADVGLSNE